MWLLEWLCATLGSSRERFADVFLCKRISKHLPLSAFNLFYKLSLSPHTRFVGFTLCSNVAFSFADFLCFSTLLLIFRLFCNVLLFSNTCPNCYQGVALLRGRWYNISITKEADLQ